MTELEVLRGRCAGGEKEGSGDLGTLIDMLLLGLLPTAATPANPEKDERWWWLLVEKGVPVDGAEAVLVVLVKVGSVPAVVMMR